MSKYIELHYETAQDTYSGLGTLVYNGVVDGDRYNDVEAINRHINASNHRDTIRAVIVRNGRTNKVSYKSCVLNGKVVSRKEYKKNRLILKLAGVNNG